jgi:hypothetical protein
MNWKRGFIRLWLAASAAWVAFAAFLLLEQIRTLNDPVTLKVGEMSLEFPGTIKRDAMHKAVVTYLKEEEVTWRDFQPDPIDYDKAADRFMAGYEPRTLAGPIYQFGVIGLAPPIATFALGGVLWWIAAGFRPSRPGPTKTDP